MMDQERDVMQRAKQAISSFRQYNSNQRYNQFNATAAAPHREGLIKESIPTLLLTPGYIKIERKENNNKSLTPRRIGQGVIAA